MLCPHLSNMLDLCGEAGLSCFVCGLCRLLLLRCRLLAHFRCLFLSVSFNARFLRPFCLCYFAHSLSLFGGCLGPVPEFACYIFEHICFCVCLRISFSKLLIPLLLFSLKLCVCFHPHLCFLRMFFCRMFFSSCSAMAVCRFIFPPTSCFASAANPAPC